MALLFVEASALSELDENGWLPIHHAAANKVLL